MKVVLTAFGGRLKSDVMDFPESSDNRIRMLLDLDVLRPFDVIHREPSFTSTSVMCEFVSEDRYLILSDGTSAKLFRLVNVEKG
jgi:hypothetical protein